MHWVSKSSTYRVTYFVISKVNVNKTHIICSFMMFLFYCEVWMWNVSTRSVESIDSFEVIFDDFLTHIGRYLSQLHLRTKERTKQTTILFINMRTECEMCSIAEENSPFLSYVKINFMRCVIVKRFIFINVRLSTEKIKIGFTT